MKALILLSGILFVSLSGCGDDEASNMTQARTAGMVSGNAPASCQSIGDACQAAGFAPGSYSSGGGYWRNCVNPLVQGQSGIIAGNTLPLPAVDASVINSCRSDSGGGFGGGKVGSTDTVTVTTTVNAPASTSSAAPSGATTGPTVTAVDTRQ